VSCQTAFFAGLGLGAVPWAFIDLTILVILWPLREFVIVMRDPLAKARIRLLLDLPLTEEQKALLKAARERST